MPVWACGAATVRERWPASFCKLALLSLALPALALGQDIYDVLLKNGHVVDPKNGRNERLDIAITGDRVRKISTAVPARQARRTIDVSNYYVTPGLIDLRMHLAGPSGIVVDHNALRHGVTTAVDPGTWKDFERFKAEVVDRSQTRVLTVDAKLAQKYPAIVVAVTTRQPPETISTGLNRDTVLLPRDTMTNVLSKHLARGLTIGQVIERTTVNAAKATGRADLGSIEEGGVADIAVFDLEKTDKRLRCVLTIRNGRVVWDTEGLSLTDWKDAGPYSNFK